MSGCAQIARVRDAFDPAVRMASEVTIIRDSWGIPHIYGPTDASVVFGLAYAQAEDNFWQLEEDHVFALGRAASVYGEAELGHDLVRAAFEVERLSRQEYEREPPERKVLWDAYAAGLNYFLRAHPEIVPRAIRRFEPWFPFALFRSASAGSVVDGVRLRDVIASPVGSPALVRRPPGPQRTAGADVPPPPSAPAREPWVEPDGSNAWAVAPGRTRDGHALLFQNPHVSFFGSGQRWEAHLQSGEGWHVAGFAILGTPMIRSGHNEHLGWTHTNTRADAADAFMLRFEHPTDPLAYRHGGEWRQAVTFEDDILVATTAGVERRRYRFLRTHHGPVVGYADGRRAAVSIARFEDGGSLQQWYALGRAGSLDEFRDALGGTAFPISNTTYADRDGNIYYVHGNAVPRRDPRFDWTRPVDGADPATDWQGYHALEELPQLLNPAAGWLQNTNSTPFLASADGSNPASGAYPSYMVREGENARMRTSRRILERETRWTFDAWAAAAFDTYVVAAEDAVPLMIDEWERLGARDPGRAARLDGVIDSLRVWDRVGTIESTAMTSFVLWTQQMARPGAREGEWASLRALEAAVAALDSTWGTHHVPWGEMNRLQRVHTSGREPFDDTLPSLPVPGAPGAVGVIFNFSSRPGPDGRRHYGWRGHTWVSVVEFGPAVRARSVVTFGQSADPSSPHWLDQAALYAAGRLRPAWFARADVEADAVRTYRPGERPLAGPDETSRAPRD